MHGICSGRFPPRLKSYITILRKSHIFQKIVIFEASVGRFGLLSRPNFRRKNRLWHFFAAQFSVPFSFPKIRPKVDI